MDAGSRRRKAIGGLPVGGEFVCLPKQLSGLQHALRCRRSRGRFAPVSFGSSLRCAARRTLPRNAYCAPGPFPAASPRGCGPRGVDVMKSERPKVSVRGLVQGVGFRPFVYWLATQMRLKGWVSNSAQGVFIEVEGGPESIRVFLLRLEKDKPPRAVIQSLEFSFLDAAGHDSFEIRFSEENGRKTALILPDIAICGDCLRDIFDPNNRRHRYPFTNCTNCGPRFTIIEALPYDRANTSMKKFALCPECEAEYRDPLGR